MAPFPFAGCLPPGPGGCVCRVASLDPFARFLPGLTPGCVAGPRFCAAPCGLCPLGLRVPARILRYLGAARLPACCLAWPVFPRLSVLNVPAGVSGVEYRPGASFRLDLPSLDPVSCPGASGLGLLSYKLGGVPFPAARYVAPAAGIRAPERAKRKALFSGPLGPVLATMPRRCARGCLSPWRLLFLPAGHAARKVPAGWKGRPGCAVS